MGDSPTRMTCTLDAKDLIAATGWAVRRVSKDSTDPILNGMLIEVYEGDDCPIVSLAGFDRDVSHAADVISATMDGAPGRVVVSGRKLAELVKTFPGKPVRMEEHDASLSLDCGSVHLRMPLMTAEDYPALPVAAESIGTIEAAVLREAVGRVIAAADQKGANSKPAQTGVLLTFEPDHIDLRTTNGYRVAVTVADWSASVLPVLEGGASVRALVPWAVLGDLAHVLEDGTVTIGFNGDTVSFTGPDRTVVSRLLDAAAFPVFRKLTERSDTATVVEIGALREALKRAELALEPKEAVTLAFSRLSEEDDADACGLTPGEVEVRGGDGGRETVSTTVECRHSGAAVNVRINPGYLADALVACGTSTAELTLPPDDRKPVLVTAPEVAGFLHLIMPIRELKS